MTTSEKKSLSVRIGEVRAFPGVAPDKAQALKVLEEAAEVFGAWQHAENSGEHYENPAIRGASTYAHAEFAVIMDEIADTIQACANLAAALGVADLAPYMAECEERNRERGRYDG